MSTTPAAPAGRLCTQFWREEAAPHAGLLPALCTLRQAAGAVIESLILADRALFLLEGAQQAQHAQQQQHQPGAGQPQKQQQQHWRCDQPPAALPLWLSLAGGEGLAACAGGVQCTLLPLFDPVLSPRNTALLAAKLGC